MSDGIKKCPCCGAGVALVQCPIIPQDGGPAEFKAWLKCEKCCIQTTPLPFSQSKKMILEWNRRVPSAPEIEPEQPSGGVNHTDSALPS